MRYFRIGLGLCLAALTTGAMADGMKTTTDLTEITGTFVEGGVECPLFRTDDGRGFALMGIDRGTAKIGAKARLWGQAVEFSTCQQGDAFTVERFEFDGG